MAIMIPENIEVYNGFTVGEKKVFEMLRILPDNYIVYYDISIPASEKEQSKFPDFIILSPDLGLIVLEVKDWSVDSILSMNSEEFEVLYGIGSKKLKNPLKQARDYCMKLSNLLQKKKELLQTEGDYIGKLSFGYNFGVVLPNINKSDYLKCSLKDVIDSKKVLLSNNDAILNQDLNSLLNFLRDVAKMSSYFPEITEEKINIIRSTIFPEASLSSKERKRALTIHQEQVAKTIEYGHQIIHGPVGSGKTTILQSRAMHLATTHKDWNILILTYKEMTKIAINNELHRESNAGKYSNVQVEEIKGCIQKVLNMATNSNKVYKTDKEIIQDIDLYRYREDKKNRKYDAILIDEAQDFKEEYIEFVVKELIRDSENSHLLLTVDGVQNIYLRSFQLRWAALKSDSFEKSIQLEKNYRNTAEIIEFANNFLNSPLLEKAVSNSKTNINYGICDFSSMREGKPPVVINAENLREEIKIIARRLRKSEFSGSTCVLCPDYSSLEIIQGYLDKENIGYSLLSEQDSTKELDQSIILATIEDSKGLEFEKVYLCCLCNNYFKDNEIDTVKLIYVGMTRAVEELYLICSEDNIYTNIIRNNNMHKYDVLLKIKRNSYKIKFELIKMKPVSVYEFEDESIRNIIFSFNEKTFIGEKTREKMYKELSKMKNNNWVIIDDFYLVTMIQTPFPNYSKYEIELL